MARRGSDVLLPGKICQYASSGWADGCSGAPRGRPQYPGLLSGYKVRPPWNVAGVDFRVGVPEGQPLVSWQTLSSPNYSVDLDTGSIRPSADCVFNNVDFSDGLGAGINNVSGTGANNITFINCYFNSSQWGHYVAPLQDTNGAKVTFENCIFDGIGTYYKLSGFNAFMLVNGNLTLLYNWFRNSPAQVVDYNPATGKAIVAKYNFYDNMLHNLGSCVPTCSYTEAHRNYLQLQNNNVTIGYDVEFNTTFQSWSNAGQGGEGFQIYSNGTGYIITNPVISNNTMIARPGVPTPYPVQFPNVEVTDVPVMSALIHGTAPGTTVSGTGQNNNNYFDVSGATAAYYPGTMTPAAGYSSSGNIDMNTGALIVPF